jgi:LmbE family N-acetylglucosaminyl deacetylase
MVRLHCITAHPDDEAGGFGGSLLLYRNRGVETFVTCLTPGQAARHRGNAASGEELAKLRRQEFARSCELLKVTSGEVLDYPDAGLDKVDFYEVVGELVRRIRQIRPQVLLTFGSEGGVTAHPDHSMASLFATAAFHWAGRSNRFVEQLEKGKLRPHQAQKLYYATADYILPDRQLVSLPPATATIDIAEYFEKKIEAFKQHTTQAPLFSLFEGRMRKGRPVENFHLAAASSPREISYETDLLAGIVE